MMSKSDLWIIRPACERDTDVLADIYLRVRRITFPWVDPDKFHNTDFVIHAQGERIFVCEDRIGTIVGFMTLWEPDNFIHMLYILPAFQGRGAGKALLAALPEWPKRRYRLKCLVKNMRAIAFYRTLGFEIIGDGSSPEGDYKDMQISGE